MGITTFLKRGKSFNKIAKTFAVIYIEEQTLNCLEKKDMKNKTLQLLFEAKKEIVDRMESFGFVMTDKISIPAITGSSVNRISIMQAWKVTISELLNRCEMLDCLDEAKAILINDSMKWQRDL